MRFNALRIGLCQAGLVLALAAMTPSGVHAQDGFWNWRFPVFGAPAYGSGCASGQCGPPRPVWIPGCVGGNCPAPNWSPAPMYQPPLTAPPVSPTQPVSPTNTGRPAYRDPIASRPGNSTMIPMNRESPYYEYREAPPPSAPVRRPVTPPGRSTPKNDNSPFYP